MSSTCVAYRAASGEENRSVMPDVKYDYGGSGDADSLGQMLVLHLGLTKRL